MEITRFWLLYFPRLEAFDASSAHLRKPQLAWLFLYWGADLNLSAFPIGRNGKTRAFLKEKADTFPTNHVRSSEVSGWRIVISPDFAHDSPPCWHSAMRRPAQL